MVRFRAFFAIFTLAVLVLFPSAAVLAADPPATRPCGTGSTCAKTAITCNKTGDCGDNGGNVGNWDCFADYCYFDNARQAEYDTKVNIIGFDVHTDVVDLAKPALEISIPGLNFSDTKQTLDKDGYIHVPYIGEFLSAAYKYALVIGSILAVIMIIKNGVTIILSAGGEGKMEGYHQIGQVMVGLIIMWGSFAILYTINPALTQFKPLRIKYISGKNLEIVDEKTYESVTKQKLNKSTNDLIGLAVQAGVKVGFKEPCFMITVLSQESSSKANVVGHDENYPGSANSDTRKKFLVNGLKFTGEKFTPPANETDYQAKINNKTDIKNDDVFKNMPPDFNLDWRFSHGFGLGQITLQSSYSCGGQRGREINGKCFNIPELLTPERNLEFTAELFKDSYECAANAGYSGRDQITAAFLAYNLGCSGMKKLSLEEVKQHPYAREVMSKYDTCVANPPNVSEASEDFVIPSGDNIISGKDGAGNDIVVSKTLLSDLQAVAADLKKNNIVLSITSGYRTLARQHAIAVEKCNNPDYDPNVGCAPKDSKTFACRVQNNDPETCPHTREVAVDAWATNGTAQYIRQDACDGVNHPDDNINDPCRAETHQAAVITAFRAHGFCSLKIEAWHFEHRAPYEKCT